LTSTPSGARDQQRQERPRGVVDAPPVDREDSLPLLARVVDEAAAAADRRVGEDQVDVFGPVRLQGLAAEPQHRRLIGHIALVHTDRGGRRTGGAKRQFPGLGQGVDVDVAGGDRASLGGELADQFAPHARAATGDNRDLPGKRVHPPTLISATEPG
jgi:hypothetical protein